MQLTGCCARAANGHAAAAPPSSVTNPRRSSWSNCIRSPTGWDRARHNSELAASVATQIAAGTIRAYAISASERLPTLPDLPTAKEAGIDYQMSIWAGIFAPKGTPKPILAKLADALDKSLDDPGVRAKVAELGGSIPPKSERSPAKFDRFVQEEIARWSPILKAASAGTGAN